MLSRKKVLIIAKTYPLPSSKYREIVCTAGVSDVGEFIRLYPFPFRSMQHYSQFKKYQWISIDIEKNPNDPRPESYKAFPENMELHEILSHWEQRKEIISRCRIDNMCELNSTANRTQQSLALIKPKKIVDFIIEPSERSWSPKELDSLSQGWLLEEPKNRELKKLPYKYSYKYVCDCPGCHSHTQMIEDWEVGALYWKLIAKGDTEEIANLKIKQKFYSQICADKRDLHFFVGMHSQYRSWMIIGTYYPPNKFPTVVDGQTTFWSVLKSS